MSKYGQYCPMAKALEILGDRWTLLIIRDLHTGTTQFNELERGLPGISRALLAQRLKQLQGAGVVEKRYNPNGRQRTEYRLTRAGEELEDVINSLLVWGANWAFGEPTPEELDPLLLLWWMHDRVNSDQLTDERTVVQFNFYGAETGTYWLILTPKETSLCLTDPGYEVNVLVTADLATFFKLWLGRISYHEAIRDYGVRVEGLPRHVRAFPSWFKWSPAAPTVRAAMK
jgi:DNA-binding HxlR family transcriptional regulator